MSRPRSSHLVVVPEQEAYRGDAYWRPDDSSVQEAVVTLIERHPEEFQNLLDGAELKKFDTSE